MGIAQLQIEPRHYQLPAPALSALVLPQLDQAMRQAHAELFAREFGGIVDTQAHSLLCREALESGLLDARAAQWLSLYPNTYGLHRLTNELVGRIGASFAITGDLFPAREDMLIRLNSRPADPAEAASYALTAIEAQVLAVESIVPLLAEGPDSAGAIMQATQRALMQQLKLPAYLDSALQGGFLDGYFFLESNGFADFLVTVPADLEMRVLLFKTLDAMSSFLLPFHTPASFYGERSYLTHMIGDAYRDLADRMRGESRDEIREWLLDESADHPESVSEILYYEEVSEEVVDRLLDQLYEMRELESVAGYVLAEACRSELQALHDEATQVCGRNDANLPLASALREALCLCLEREAHPVLADFNPRDYPGTADDGVSLFEGIMVDVTWDFPALREISFESFDSSVENSGYPSLGLPMNGPEFHTVTLPVLQEIGLTLDLLHRIAQATEERDNAE